MSVKASHEALHGLILSGQPKDPYGIPVSSNSPRRDKGTARVTPRGRGAMCDGVRVPVLKDIDRYALKGPTTTCRFDIVEKVTTVIKAGTYGPSDYNASVDEAGKDAGLSTDHGQRLTLNVSRQPTFHSNVSRSTEQDVWAKISPYKWNKWVKNGKEGDARDVLYKNTYCMDQDNLRYRTLMLPRLGSDRPRTVGDKPNESYRPTTPDHVKNSTGVIVPQQPRGSVVRFREYMRPSIYSSDGTGLDIKRVNSKSNMSNHFTTARSVFPLIRNDSRQCSRKSERPLAFESSRYNKNSDTLFNKQHKPIYKSAFERDYSSADTFKEYLESLQQCGTMNTPFGFSRENTKLNRENSMDYHNQVLQRVKNVNEPEVAAVPSPRAPETTPRNPDNRSITIEIKSSWKEPEDNESNSVKTPTQKEATGRTGTIDNLSSVHGSVVLPRAGTNQVTGPTSSTVVNAGIAQNKDGAVPPGGLPGSQNRRDSEGGATCPTNTPTPMDDV